MLVRRGQGAVGLVRGLMPASIWARFHAQTRHCSSSSAETPTQEYQRLLAEQEQIHGRLRQLEISNPEVRSQHCNTDAFYPPRLHHINIVSARGSKELLDFYRDVLRMDEMDVSLFPRNAEGTSEHGSGGSDVPINFTTDGQMQLHLATQDLGVAFRSGEVINPIGVGPVGHIAYRTNNIDAFKAHLETQGVAYTDYGTRFAKEWHQIFFLDPVGTIIEVHAVIE